MSTGSSTHPPQASTGHEANHWLQSVEAALALPESTRRHGMTPRAARLLNLAGGVVVLALAIGWSWSIVHARAVEPEVAATRTTATVKAALTKPDAPSAAYVTDAALTAYATRVLSSQRGLSGKMRATIQPTPGAIRPDTLPPGTSLRYERGGEVSQAPKASGIWRVVLAAGKAMRPIADFNVITMLPFSAKKGGRVGLYYVGNWPGERGAAGPKRAPAGAYANPSGFIEVTRENKDTRVSEHFKLADFLTHDQPNVWPKYLVLQPKLIDKLELVMNDLQSRGIDTRGVRVMSGFRTPQYNVGGGRTGGRASLSRHMYGDASDIFIDSNGDGQMDDLNRDGRVTIEDSRVIAAAVDRVEAAHPELIGGAGVYTAAPGHGPFIHIDTRGYRARWSGTSGG